jgi:hypothetical protein
VSGFQLDCDRPLKADTTSERKEHTHGQYRVVNSVKTSAEPSAQTGSTQGFPGDFAASAVSRCD